VSDVRDSYDRLADAYAAQLLRELEGKPLDRALLDCFAELTRGRGPVLEIGCGPGQVAGYLAARGVAVRGLDLSPEMVRVARASHPGVEFTVGDMLDLPAADGELAGIVGFYAIVNLRPDDVLRAIAEMRRSLAPGASVLLAFHVGAEIVRPGELWGVPVALDFHFFETAFVEGALAAAGLAVEARVEREPYPGVEHPSRRAYLLARR
jgi:SAM-dependent methyltransferase